MLKRNKKNRLILDSLSFEIFFGNLFEMCTDETEVEWLRQEIQNMTDCIAEEREEQI